MIPLSSMKYNNCGIVRASPPRFSWASRHISWPHQCWGCCCSVVFALLNLKFHIIVDDYGKSCYYWLCGMQIAGLNSIQDAVSPRNEKKIFWEMKINHIRSWHNRYTRFQSFYTFQQIFNRFQMNYLAEMIDLKVCSESTTMAIEHHPFRKVEREITHYRFQSL